MKDILQVSDELVKCYRLFQVLDISQHFEKLSRREKIILYLLCLENYSEWNATAISNFSLEVQLLRLIYGLQKEEPTDVDEDLEFLANKTGNKFIDTSKVIDARGLSIPEPVSEKEISILRREFQIQEILK